MRCVGCEMEPVTSARYCDSCGSRLSAAETNACESRVVGPDHWAPDGDPGSDTRCDSCGGPDANGDLCGSCQRAFFGSWLDGATPVPPATTTLADPAPIEEIPCSELVTSGALVRDSFEAAALAEMAIPAPVRREETMNSLDDTVSAAGAEAVSAEDVRAAAVRREEAKTQAARLTRPRTDATHAVRARKPVVVHNRASVPVPSQDRRPSIALAAAGLVVAAIGVGAYWLQFHEQPVIAREEQQRPVSKTVTAVTRHRPSTNVVSLAAITHSKSALRLPEGPRSARPISAASAATRPTVKAVRPPSPSTRQVALVSTPISAVDAPASAIAPIAPTVIATAPPVPPSLPVGRFFETMDVNELPRVALRVEPQVPDELRTRPLNEVVIVRVLVSQGGHPSRVSLLRRSKAGPRLDDAVIAAVNQWTFSPATRKGEAVSCWFNVGVPVSTAD